MKNFLEFITIFEETQKWNEDDLIKIIRDGKKIYVKNILDLPSHDENIPISPIEVSDGVVMLSIGGEIHQTSINNITGVENIRESQSKKISKWIDFSTFLQWYNSNRNRIADILDVNVSELTSEEEILKQSSNLINDIINVQSSGVSDRDIDGEGRTISGFDSFEKLNNKIIHDILHNLYYVTTKQFDKYSDLDYGESENIEEIEVLALEESFMKYFNIDYVKSDFVHQNINRLVGFLLMSIIRDDHERICDILDGKVEPYIEVYDKKYQNKKHTFSKSV
jgi:hypothetical protein